MSSQEVTDPLGHTIDSFGGIRAGKFQWDGAAGRLAFHRMWLTHTDRHTHAPLA